MVENESLFYKENSVASQVKTTFECPSNISLIMEEIAKESDEINKVFHILNLSIIFIIFNQFHFFSFQFFSSPNFHYPLSWN